MNETAGATGGGGGLVTFLIASLAVIGLALLFTRTMARWNVIQNRGRRLKVLEGVAIGRDRQLLLVAVGKELLVVGASDGGVSLVHKVADPDELLGENWEQAPEPKQAEPVSLAGVEASIRGSLEKMRGLLTKSGGGSDAP